MMGRQVFPRPGAIWFNLVVFLLAATLPSAGVVGAERQVLDLQTAVEMALKADSRIAMAQNDLEKAKAAVREEEVGFLPKVSLVAEHGYDLTSDERTQNFVVQIQEVLPTSWRLYGEKTATAVEVSRWDRANAEKALQIRRAEVRYDTAVLYYNALKAQRALRYRERAVENARQAAEVAKQQLALGKITKPAQLKAENDLAQAEYELKKSQADYTLALKRLANQIGVSQLESLVLDENLPEDPLRNLDYRQLKAEALQKRLEIQQGKIAVQKTEQEVLRAKNQGLPVLKLSYQNRGMTWSYGLGYSFLTGELTGTAAWRGRESGGRESISTLEDLFGSNQQTLFFEVTYNLDFGSVRSQVEQATYALENAKKSLEQSSQEIALEIDQAISDYELAATQLEVKRHALPLYQKELELARLKLSLGQATPLEVAQAEQVLLSAELEVENARCDLLAAAEKVRLVLGQLYD